MVASLRSIVRARTPGGPSAPPLGRTTRALGAASALFGVTLLLMMLAWRCPPGAVALHFPLGSGTFAIHQGGSSFALNGHALVKAQAFAVDIVKINALGMRARGFILSDPEAFGIYGEPVYAPCDGEVLALVETATAPSAPQASRHAVGRRYVVLYCEGVSVLFANLGAGSAPLEQGARVTVGDLIGHVGQTGDGSEPHLHVHAVRGRQPDLRRITAGAEPVPIRFDGRFLVRNDRVTIPPRDP
jgi:hypothetical protein